MTAGSEDKVQEHPQKEQKDKDNQENSITKDCKKLSGPIHVVQELNKTGSRKERTGRIIILEMRHRTVGPGEPTAGQGNEWKTFKAYNNETSEH